MELLSVSRFFMSFSVKLEPLFSFYKKERILELKRFLPTKF